MTFPSELERQAADGQPTYRNMGRAEAPEWEGEEAGRWQWEGGVRGRDAE